MKEIKIYCNLLKLNNAQIKYKIHHLVMFKLLIQFSKQFKN